MKYIKYIGHWHFIFLFVQSSGYTQPDDCQLRRKHIAVGYIGMYSCADGTLLNTLPPFQTKYNDSPICTQTQIFFFNYRKVYFAYTDFLYKPNAADKRLFPFDHIHGHSTFKAILSIRVSNISQHLQVLQDFLGQLLNIRQKNVKL